MKGELKQDPRQRRISWSPIVRVIMHGLLHMHTPPLPLHAAPARGLCTRHLHIAPTKMNKRPRKEIVTSTPFTTFSRTHLWTANAFTSTIMGTIKNLKVKELNGVCLKIKLCFCDGALVWCICLAPWLHCPSILPRLLDALSSFGEGLLLPRLCRCPES